MSSYVPGHQFWTLTFHAKIPHCITDICWSHQRRNDWTIASFHRSLQLPWQQQLQQLEIGRWKLVSLMVSRTALKGGKTNAIIIDYYFCNNHTSVPGLKTQMLFCFIVCYYIVLNQFVHYNLHVIVQIKPVPTPPPGDRVRACITVSSEYASPSQNHEASWNRHFPCASSEQTSNSKQWRVLQLFYGQSTLSEKNFQGMEG